MSNLGEKCAVLICILSIDRCIYYMFSSKNLKCFEIFVAASGAKLMPDREARPDRGGLFLLDLYIP